MQLKFTDGVVIDTSGPLRKLHLHDGWYVVGVGFCIPVSSEHEADQTLLQMSKPAPPCDPKATKSYVSSSRTQLIFVYGTLRQGQGNHYLLRSSKFIGIAKTKELYALYAQGIPFLSRASSISQITGEVYSVDDDTLERLDRLEGHPGWYRREQAEVVLDEGSEMTAWIYFHDSPHGDLIESGDFMEDSSTKRGKHGV